MFRVLGMMWIVGVALLLCTIEPRIMVGASSWWSYGETSESTKGHIPARHENSGLPISHHNTAPIEIKARRNTQRASIDNSNEESEDFRRVTRPSSFDHRRSGTSQVRESKLGGSLKDESLLLGRPRSNAVLQPSKDAQHSNNQRQRVLRPKETQSRLKESKETLSRDQQQMDPKEFFDAVMDKLSDWLVTTGAEERLSPDNADGEEKESEDYSSDDSRRAEYDGRLVSQSFIDDKSSILANGKFGPGQLHTPTSTPNDSFLWHPELGPKGKQSPFPNNPRARDEDGEDWYLGNSVFSPPREYKKEVGFNVPPMVRRHNPDDEPFTETDLDTFQPIERFEESSNESLSLHSFVASSFNHSPNHETKTPSPYEMVSQQHTPPFERISQDNSVLHSPNYSYSFPPSAFQSHRPSNQPSRQPSQPPSKTPSPPQEVNKSFKCNLPDEQISKSIDDMEDEPLPAYSPPQTKEEDLELVERFDDVAIEERKENSENQLVKYDPRGHHQIAPMSNRQQSHSTTRILPGVSAYAGRMLFPYSIGLRDMYAHPPARKSSNSFDSLDTD